MKTAPPSFDRFLIAISRQEPDRVPLAEMWIDPEVKEGFLGYAVRSLQDEINFWEKSGHDYLIIDTDLYATPQIQQAIINPRTNTANIYADHRLKRNWVSSTVKAIASWEDVEQFSWPSANQLDYSIYEYVSHLLPPGMKVVVTFGHLFTATWQLMGFENFCITTIEDPDLIQNIIDRLGEETIYLLERILEFDCVGAVCFQDDLAYTNGLMVSPQQLRNFIFPWLERLTNITHTLGRPLLFHTDGDVSQIIPDIITIGVDALHPIEPKCLDIVAIKKEYGDRIALIGNVDLGYTLTRGTPQEVIEEVKFLIKNVAPGGGYLLSSSNSITNYVPLENYKALLKANLEFGLYPISV